MDSGKNVWIAWERQRRSLVLSKEFECELFIYEKRHHYKVVRYIMASISTISFVLRKKPKVVFVQNPSMILTVLLCWARKIFGYKIVVDRHSNFMFGRENKFLYGFFKLCSEYTIKNADLTIVTNKELKEKFIDRVGGKGAVLPDMIPDMNSYTFKRKKVSKKTVFFITSFSNDEPISEFFEAIDSLPEDYFFYVSGNYLKSKNIWSPKGRNYLLTGFIEDSTFKSILNSVDAVMVFTKNEMTLTCGAYEGLSAGKPLILSNTKTIKEYFKAGSVYCDPNPYSIKSGILKCFDNYDQLKNEIDSLKEELNRSWRAQFRNIKEMLSII